MDNSDTEGSFHTLAMVILAPVKINRISLRVSLGTHGTKPLSKAIEGVWGIAQPVTL